MNLENSHIYEYGVDLSSDCAPARVVRMVGQNKRVLDVGAGAGSISKLLQEVGHCRVTGLEINKEAIKKLSPYCERVYEADLNDSAWPELLADEDPFEVLVAADVLEHVYDPQAVLKAMLSLAAKDGQLVISLPHIAHNAILASLLDEDFEYRDWGLLDRTHLRFFGIKNIQKLFESAGLKIVDAQFVIIPSEETEFSEKWNSLSYELKNILQKNRFGEVYQVVIKAVSKEQEGAAINLMTLSAGLMNDSVFANYGYCYCCDQAVRFTADDNWFRDYYICSECGSIPRERALAWSMDKFFPDWRQATVHESSPVPRGVSEKLKQHCNHYIASQYFPGIESGEEHQGWRCENLEALSFADNSIDLHISQDVIEHLFNPDLAFQEIARTLRPGGMHIFTVPLVKKGSASEICAELGEDGTVEHLLEPEYHGNPVSEQGALVTRRWGYDICDYIFKSSGLFTRIIHLDALEWGIRAEYIEVLVTVKPLARADYTVPEPGPAKQIKNPDCGPFAWLKAKLKI